MEHKFIFDLDSTITKKEILPAIAERFDLGEIVRKETEAAMCGEVPFAESFSRRVALLAHCPVGEASDLVAGIPLNEGIAAFIRKNSESCYIATGNLDVWIEKLVAALGALEGHVFCSKAVAKGDCTLEVSEVFGPEQKAELVRRLGVRHNTVAIGDGANDIEMCRAADIGIAFGGVREIPEGLRFACGQIFSSDRECAEFLNHLIGV